jgi:hypothetical protein
MDQKLSDQVEEDYREKELDNLDKEYLSENSDIKFDFFKNLKTLFFRIEQYKYLDDLENSKYDELFFNENKNEKINKFFINYLNNKNKYNNGEFFANNEHLIYKEYKEFDDDFSNIFYDPFLKFERDLNKRENYNFNRLFKAISETTLNTIEEVSLQDYDFTEIKRYEDEEPQILYYNGEEQVE